MSRRARDELDRRMQEVAERVGPWQSHNIYLRDGVFTIADRAMTSNFKLGHVLQVASDLAGGSLKGLRVLDLACEEGMFGIEFARHGAEVVAIDGRQVHLEHARFAAEAVGLDNCQFVLDDIRNVSRETYGEFDIVLCLGILYHLTTPDLFEVVHRLRDLTRRFIVVHTSVGLKPVRTVDFNGTSYSGQPVFEHPADATEAEKRARLRASLENTGAFWITRPSLFNLLGDAGFSSVFEVRLPRPGQHRTDRAFLVGTCGEAVDVLSAPDLSDQRRARWSERERGVIAGRLRRRGRLKRWLNEHGFPTR